MRIVAAILAFVPAALCASRAATATSIQPEAAAKTSPVRMILLCLGRSGSTETVQVLSNFSNNSYDDNRGVGLELFGSDATAMANLADPNQTMFEHFETEAQAKPYATVVGFNWKPVIWADKYDLALEAAAKAGVRVIYQRRNVLDVWISECKHQKDDELTAHCDVDDAECIAEHTSLQIRLNVDDLIERLDGYKLLHETAIERLNTYNVAYVNVTYDNIFAGEASASVPVHNESLALAEWNVALENIGLPTLASYATLDQVLSSGYAPTTPATQCDELFNAYEVRATLKGTKYEELLRC